MLGVNVPPPPPLDGVTITVPVTVPPAGVKVTVKLVEATPTVPVEGPDNEYPVAAGGETV